MQKGKVLILEDSSKSSFGGGQVVTLAVIGALKEHFDLILSDTRDQTTFNERAKPQCGSFIGIHCHGVIANRAVSSFNLTLKEVLVSPYYFLKNTRILIRALKPLAGENVLLYATTKKSLVYAYILYKVMKCPYIFHVHSAGDRSLFSLLMKPMYVAAQSLLCVSDFVKSSIGLPNAITLHNPVNTTKGVKPRTIDGKAVITVGLFAKLLKWKGVDYFMKSYSFLKYHERVRYAVYGDGPERVALQRYENDAVRLKGFCTNPVLEMDGIDLLVVPSVAEESFGLTIAEAFAKGIPVIATGIGGQAEIVKDGISGLHVPVGDSRAIAVAIDYFLEAPVSYERFSGNALLQAEVFNHDRFSRSVLQIFERVCGFCN